MSSARQPVQFAQVKSFDGHKLIVSPGQPGEEERVYELDRYLGGGSAGVVYEATHTGSGQSFAVKIITPIPYKLQSQAALKRCHVAVRGTSAEALEAQHARPLDRSDLWWLYEPYSREVVPAVADSKGALKELSLGKSVALWGLTPPEAAPYLSGSNVDRAAAAAGNEHSVVCLQGSNVHIPRVPLKYIAFLRARANIYREIHAMAVISPHPNVLSLHAVLEYVQDSKATFFLVMDLASGGELLEHIRDTTGVCSEARARVYMSQLLSGVKHCHAHGVAHRDLKPENLLLTTPPHHDDGRASPVLVIADFGLSAVIGAMEATGTPPMTPATSSTWEVASTGGSALRPRCPAR